MRSSELRRREFITLVGAAAAARSLSARAEEPAGMRRIGVLIGGSDSSPQSIEGVAAFAKELAQRGWIEGRNVHIDYRWGNADIGRIKAFAKELVGMSPAVIVGATTPVIAALQNETKTTPIVFTVVSDPVGSGFVASLPRPGGNITGFINLESSLSGKWIEILKDVEPGIAHAALLYNPQTAPYFAYYLQPFEAAARSSAIEPIGSPVHGTGDIERVIAGIADKPNVGLAVMPDVFTGAEVNYQSIISLAGKYRIPTVYPYRYMVKPGGLICYGIDIIDLYRGAAVYADRILKGDKPADLPVQLPTKFELVVNLATAKALGIEIPSKLLSLADEVIE